MNTKWSAIIVILLSIVFAACSGGVNRRPLEELAANSAGSTAYTVSRGDTLMINVWGEPRLSGEAIVRDDGKLTMPLIGEVPGEGKSLADLTSEITKKLDTFIPSAAVSISVVRVAPTRYYLSGMFVKPGEYRSDGRISFLQAVATGGGFAPFADESSITLIRKTAEGEIRYDLDHNRVLDGHEPNPELKDGDIIAVQQ